MTRTCRSCRSPVDHVVLDLGPQPSADWFPRQDDPDDDPRWPLTALVCNACWLVQLAPLDDPPPEAPMLAVESATARAHAAEAAAAIVTRVDAGPTSRVLEVPSHHGGSMLPSLLEHGLEDATDGGPADVVVDNHWLAHQPDLDDALARLRGRLRPGGWLVLELHHLLALVQGRQLDTIRHGHWSYPSLLALVPALARNGLAVVDAESVAVYGGSLRVYARAVDAASGVAPGGGDVLAGERAAGLDRIEGFAALASDAASVRDALVAMLRDAHAAGHAVAGYGAPSKAVTLLNWCGIGPDLLPFTVDQAPQKHGRAIPGCRVPILAPSALDERQPDVVLVLTWDLLDEISEQLAHLTRQGTRLLIPLPAPRLL